MSTRVNGRYTPHPDSSSDTACRFPFCTRPVSRRFLGEGIHLCQDHALHTWATVQRMMEADTIKPKPAPQPARTDGFVYYIRIGDRVKIGHTADLDRRLSSYPPGLKVLFIRRGDRELETSEHRRYREYLTDGREWFAADPRLVESIAATKAAVGYDVTTDWDPDAFPRRRHEPQTITHRKLMR